MLIFIAPALFSHFTLFLLKWILCIPFPLFFGCIVIDLPRMAGSSCTVWRMKRVRHFDRYSLQLCCSFPGVAFRTSLSMYITSLREGLAKHYYSSADTQNKQRKRERERGRSETHSGERIDAFNQLHSTAGGVTEWRWNGVDPETISGREWGLSAWLKDQRKTRCIWQGIEFEVYKVRKLEAELQMNECDLIQTCKPTY